MTTYLLDVNVLIALVDPSHVQHEQAHAWFTTTGQASFASCPLTENGLVRIVGHPKYPNSPGPPSTLVETLRAIRSLPGHVFWPDTLSVADPQHFSSARLAHHAQVTDSYLLALARAHKGRLATMDIKLVADAVPDGKAHLELIPVGR